MKYEWPTLEGRLSHPFVTRLEALEQLSRSPGVTMSNEARKELEEGRRKARTPISKNQFHDLWEAEDKRHREAIDTLRKRNCEFQKTCEHPQKHVHCFPDPSGNNDSYNECSICGKQW